MFIYCIVVVKVPLEMSVSNAAFVSQLEKKLTALLKAAFSQKLIKERPSYKPAETERRKRSQFDIPSDICTKVCRVYKELLRLFAYALYIYFLKINT